MMKTVVSKMVEASSRPFALGVSGIADMGNDGKAIPFKQVKTPY